MEAAAAEPGKSAPANANPRQAAAGHAAAMALAADLLTMTDLDAISVRVVHHAQQLTASSFGCAGYIDPGSGSLICPAMNRILHEHGQDADKSVEYEQLGRLWSMVAQTRTATFSNDVAREFPASGAPVGRLAITRFLCAPALLGAELVGHVALANATHAYTADDLALVERLAIFYAIAIRHHRAELALRESEDKLRTIFAIAPVGLSVIDEDHRLTDMNPALARIVALPPPGLQAGEYTGRRYLHRDGRPMTREEFPSQVALRTGAPVHDVEVGIVTEESKTIWTSVSAAPLPGFGAVIATVDITERKQIEAELRRHQLHLEAMIQVRTAALEQEIAERKRIEAALTVNLAKYRALIDSLPLGVSITDETGKLIESNPVAARILGVPKEEHESRTLEDAVWVVLRPDGTPMPAAEFAGMRALREDRLVENVEMGVVKGPGEVTWINVNAAPIAAQGYGVAITYTDITPRVLADQALRASEERYRKIVETAQEGIWVIDAETRTTFANQTMAAILGYTVEEMLGQPLYTFMDAEGQAIAAENVERRKRGITETHDFKFMRKDGTPVWALLNTNPMLDAQGRYAGALAMVTDITARKQAEADLAQYAAELERSNADLQQFAYVASHDLQEPLRMVASYVQLLAADYQGRLEPEADEYIAYAVDGARRMQQLIQDLLAYSRVSTATQTIAATDTQAVLGDVIAALRLSIDETGATIIVEPLPTLPADRTQLVQLLLNLVGNALKYHSAAPPIVRVRADYVPATAANTPAYWQFSVQDNGIGIEPQYHERIFMMFQRLHNRSQYPGTGLGLAICRRIVERHRGKIWVESALGHGATFFFTLPA